MPDIARVQDFMHEENWWKVREVFLDAEKRGAVIGHVEPTGQIVVLENTRTGIKGIPYRFIAFGRKYAGWEDYKLLPLAEIWGEAIAAMNSEWDIRIVRGEEIPYAYENLFNRPGLRSCMTGDKARFTEFYAMFPDKIGLALGYKNGKVVARTLVWNVNGGDKVRDRVYAVSASLAHSFADLLNAQGYRLAVYADSVSLKGIRDMDDYYFPYMDTFRYGRLARNELILRADSDGCDFTFDCTDGSYHPTRACKRCGRAMGEDDYVYVDDVGEYWCMDCINDHANTCERCGDVVADAVYLEDRQDFWCRHCAERYAETCERCDEWVEEVHHVADVDEHWCNTCISNHAYTCEHCDAYVTETVVLVDTRQRWCTECADNEAHICEKCGDVRRHPCNECEEENDDE